MQRDRNIRIPQVGPDAREPLKPRMSEKNFVVGVWEIIDCALEASREDNEGVLGTVFELSPTGDVTWKLPERPRDIPLFHCDTYEVVSRGPFLSNLLRFGSYKGHVIEFRMERYRPDVKTIMLHEGLFFMTCKRLDSLNFDSVLELPYSLLAAYEEGYFTDLSIFGSNGREFRVHTCILKLTMPDVDWAAEPPPLSGLNPNVINTVLHFMYAHCLPRYITQPVAELVVKVASNYPGLERLISMCQTYIRNVTLTRDIITLVSEIHSCGVQLMDHFGNRGNRGALTDPAAICSAVKNSLKDFALAISKMLVLCDLYNKRKHEFSRKGGHEIVRFTKSRIPIFVSQVENFLQSARNTFSGLAVPERNELALYLLPDLDNIFDTLISILVKVRTFLEAVLTRRHVETGGKGGVKMETLKQHVDRGLRKKEISKIRFILHKIDSVITQLRKKRESFQSMNNEDKIRTLSSNLEQVIEKFPFLILRLEELADEIDDKLEWHESQFCFKVGTTRVDEILKAFLENKESLQDLVLLLCNLIQRDGFTQAAVTLGILDSSVTTGENIPESRELAKEYEKHLYRAFNLTEFLCEPPPPRKNPLAKAAIRMFKNSQDTDMIFSVIASEDTNTDTDETEESEEASADAGSQGASHDGEGQATTAAGPEVAMAEMANAEAMAEVVIEVDMAELGTEVTMAELGTETAMAELVFEVDMTDVIIEGDMIEIGSEVEMTDVESEAAMAEVITEAAVAEVVTEAAVAEVVTEAAMAEAETEAAAKKQPEKEREPLKIEAHRAIVSARCTWFRKALLSGMKEDTERLIMVHNVDPMLFSMFMNYLYSGLLDYSSLSMDQISQMLLLADWYELENLKNSFENILKLYINDDTTLYLLGIGDKYNAKILKHGCLHYISQHADLTVNCKIFERLRPHLKIQIYDLVVWSRQQLMLSRNMGRPPINLAEFRPMGEIVPLAQLVPLARFMSFTGFRSLDEHQFVASRRHADEPRRATFRGRVRELRRAAGDEVGAGLEVPSDLNADGAVAAELEIENQIAEEEARRFEARIAQLREIVGPGAPRSQLIQVILAADLDLNRALNYYYSS